jgi:hypothetical protein
MIEEDPLDTNERSMRMRIASYHSWAQTKDRSARTAAARKRSHHTRFIEKARELHPDGTEEQIAAAAEALKSAHYRELALKSAQSRRIRGEMAQAAKSKRAAQLLAEAGTGPAAA